MTTPRAIVLRAAGINCDRETHAVCASAGFQVDVLHVNRLIEKPELLHESHFIVVPGGFSYGDDLGAGKVLANELKTKLFPEFRKFVAAGRLVLGICNGFQVLVKSGLLPDAETPEPGTLTITDNDSGRYEDRWVWLKVCSVKSAFLNTEEIIELPIAHGEGKFVARDDSVLRRWEEAGQLVLKYVDREGREAGYPWNPNGSMSGVAGICDPTGRVLGLMPHPERFMDAVNHPRWTRRVRDGEPDGLRFFRNAFDYVKKNL